MLNDDIIKFNQTKKKKKFKDSIGENPRRIKSKNKLII